MKFWFKKIDFSDVFLKTNLKKFKNIKKNKIMNTLPIKNGDNGQTVAEVQKYLALLHYDILTDGNFGSATKNAVRDFQEKNQLVVDGMVGTATYDLLKTKAGQVVDTNTNVINQNANVTTDGLNIITTCKLSEAQYVKTIYNKTQIFIHFTAGGPSAKNVITGWEADEPRVATAYVIDGDTGDVYNCFDDKYYAYHLGISGANGKLDQASIGIEICAWGPLTEKNGKYYNYLNKEVSVDKVYKLDQPFRKYSYFYAFSDKQYDSLEKLLRYLIKKYNIKIQKQFDTSICEFNQELIDKVLPGIYFHTTVRKDKSDMFAYKELLVILNKLASEFNS